MRYILRLFLLIMCLVFLSTETLQAESRCSPSSFRTELNVFKLRDENGHVVFQTRRGIGTSTIKVRGVARIPIFNREGYPPTEMPAFEIADLRINKRETRLRKRFRKLLRQIKRGKKVYLVLFNPLTGETPVNWKKVKLSDCLTWQLEEARTYQLIPPITTRFYYCGARKITINQIILNSFSSGLGEFTWKFYSEEGRWSGSWYMIDSERLKLSRAVLKEVEQDTGILIPYRYVYAPGDEGYNPRPPPKVTWIE